MPASEAAAEAAGGGCPRRFAAAAVISIAAAVSGKNLDRCLVVEEDGNGSSGGRRLFSLRGPPRARRSSYSCSSTDIIYFDSNSPALESSLGVPYQKQGIPIPNIRMECCLYISQWSGFGFLFLLLLLLLGVPRNCLASLPPLIETRGRGVRSHSQRSLSGTLPTYIVLQPTACEEEGGRREALWCANALHYLCHSRRVSGFFSPWWGK